MFIKNLKFFLRNFRKDRIIVSINSISMIIGILVALLTSFYTFYQLSYDKYVKDYQNIYRIEYVEYQNGTKNHYAGCSESLANILKEEVPGIKDIMILSYVGFSHQLYCEGKEILLSDNLIITPNYLDYYDVQFEKGSKENFNRKTSLLITESFAKKYFPDDDPIGKELTHNPNSDLAYVISGIIKDIPSNSHFTADALELQNSHWQEKEEIDHYKASNLVESYDNVYLILEDNVKIEQILSYFPAVKKKYLSKYLNENNLDLKLSATNIAKTHFQQGLIYDKPTQNINSIYFFLLIAAIVIIISIINFLNLSLARKTGRNIDVGIRKTMGATRTQIFKQHLSESFIFIIGCLAVSLILFYYLLPHFAEYYNLNLENARYPNYYLVTIPIFIIIALITSLYPALIISSQNPIGLFNGKSRKQKFTGRLFLLATQIILSVVCFIVTLVINSQMKFINSSDKGYNLENVIVYEYMNIPGIFSSDEICESLERSSYIEETTISTKLPGQNIDQLSVYVDLPEQQMLVNTGFYHINEDYLPFMNIEILAGRNFDEDISSDLTKFIVNESFVKAFSNPENAIGTRVYLTQSENNNYTTLDGEIIGVVKDYHFQSLHQKINPLILTISEYAPNYFHIKYNPQNFENVLKHSNQVFDDLALIIGFTAQKHFPEEDLLRKYETERNLSQMTIWLSTLSILLALFGIFGLTALIVKSNMKMMCIRKVFGANKQDLYKLMFRNFRFVFTVSNFIAAPIAWYVCTKWLERFAYHISISVWLFVSGLVMSGIIVFVALIYHVEIVDSTDPVVFLSDE